MKLVLKPTLFQRRKKKSRALQTSIEASKIFALRRSKRCLYPFAFVTTVSENVLPKLGDGTQLRIASRKSGQIRENVRISVGQSPKGNKS
jgi:hypothetical protein